MDKIAVLDFGGQYAHLIANRVRRLGIYSEIFDGEVKAAKLRDFKGVILSGGPQSVYEKGSPQMDPAIFKLEVPVLGICYGHQLIAHTLGGKVVPGNAREYGNAQLQIRKKQGVFKGLPAKTAVWMSHGDEVEKLPPGFEELAYTKEARCTAVGDLKRNIFGLQYHVEVTHTKDGMKMLENFLSLCKARREWDMAQFLKEEINKVRNEVGDRNVFLLVSGGVDSMVVFALLDEAIGSKKVYGLFVDTGLMRKNEGREVHDSLKLMGFKNFHIYNARSEFVSALKGVTNPERKRKIIGNMFLKIQRKVVRKLKLDPASWMLGQGTIYPDTIETGGTKHAAKIKTHHNRVPEIEAMIRKGLVIEPVKELYKDEVRSVGRRLGLPTHLVERHPFPGPGLGVRILCTKKALPLREHEKVEVKLSEFISDSGLSTRVMPIKSVGVQGDGRSYRHPAVVFGSKLSWPRYSEIATRMTNSFSEINRVCLALWPSKVSTLRARAAYITPRRIKLLQEADAIVRDFIEVNGLQQKIWQFPVVLLPISANERTGETVVLRPVVSQEAMTANFYPMKRELLDKLVLRLRKLPGVSAVMYDITNKPPGTIEWE